MRIIERRLLLAIKKQKLANRFKGCLYVIFMLHAHLLTIIMERFHNIYLFRMFLCGCQLWELSIPGKEIQLFILTVCMAINSKDYIWIIY